MSITKNYQSAKGTYKVTFNFLKSSAPEAKSVVLLGDFNNWDINSAPKMKAGKEAFSTSLELKAGTYEFRYFIDQIKWENDPSADNFVSSPFVGIHNSVINLPPVADKKAVKTTSSKVAVKTTPVKTTPVKVAAAKPEAKKVIATTPSKATAKAAPVKAAKPEAKKVATSTPAKVAVKATPVKVAAAKPEATKVATAKPATPKVAATKKVVKTKASK